jgi:hypothetical protein
MSNLTQPERAIPERRFSATTNSKLLSFLKAQATSLPPQSLAILEARRARNTPPDEAQRPVDPYHTQTHPDLSDRLYELAEPIPEACRDVVYGCPVLATPKGIIFALARGTNGIAFRVPVTLYPMALGSGGKPAVAYGVNWIEFDAWPEGNQINNLREWCRLAYDKAV